MTNPFHYIFYVFYYYFIDGITQPDVFSAEYKQQRPIK